MKQQEVFKKIGGILKELNDQYGYLEEIDGQLNDLELELFLANSHFLTDHLLILSKLNAQYKPVEKIAEKPAEKVIETPAEKPIEKIETPQEPKYFEPLVQPINAKNTAAINGTGHHTDEANAIPHIDLQNGSLDDSYSFEREEPETIRHELILDEADWEDEDEPYETVDDKLDDEVETVAEDKVEIAPVPEQPVVAPEVLVKVTEVPLIPPPPVIAEQPKTEEPQKAPDVLTINERIMAQLAAEKGGSTATSGQQAIQPISDLKQAINLNDKLLFVKDLFNGYSLAYSEAIEILNRFNSFDEGDLFLKKNYVAKNNWDSKPDTTAKFYELLKRRYA